MCITWEWTEWDGDSLNSNDKQWSETEQDAVSIESNDAGSAPETDAIDEMSTS